MGLQHLPRQHSGFVLYTKNRAELFASNEVISQVFNSGLLCIQLNCYISLLDATPFFLHHFVWCNVTFCSSVSLHVVISLFNFLMFFHCFVPGLQVCGMFFKTSQADNGRVVKMACQRIFKKNSALKVWSACILCIFTTCRSVSVSTCRCSTLEEWDSLFRPLNAGLCVRGSCTLFICYTDQLYLRRILESDGMTSFLTKLLVSARHKFVCQTSLFINELGNAWHSVGMLSIWTLILTLHACWLLLFWCLAMPRWWTTTVVALKHPEWPITAEHLQWGPSPSKQWIRMEKSCTVRQHEMLL